MAKLCVNVDHIATLREARKITEPDPVQAAALCEEAGAVGITMHLREDRRHMQDHDLDRLREKVTTLLNLEMAATEEMVKIALDRRPDQVTLVPEKREEVTTEGGLDVRGQLEVIRRATGVIQEAGIPVSLFIDPDPEQVKAAAETGAKMIELHTGRYANEAEDQAHWLSVLGRECMHAQSLGLVVHAGHGLNYDNVGPVAAFPGLEELNIGHSIISRAVFVGIGEAVREMDRLIRGASALDHS